MLNEKKIKNLHQFLTKQNSNSSKIVSLNIRSETTSPSSYNERNYSTQSKLLNNETNNKNNKIQHYLGYKKSNTIDKNCYNNINLLSNFKVQEDNNNDSFSKDINKSNFSNTSKINVVSILKNKNGALYDKSLFLHIMKYFTRKAKNDIILNDEINFFLNPIIKLLNSPKKKSINIKNIKKELDKKGINHNSNSTYNNNKEDKNLNNNIDNNIKINSNEKGNYIGIDDNFNLTFGKSSNKIEIFNPKNIGINIKNNNKNIKSKNKMIHNNFIFNINKFKNIINSNKIKNNNNEKIDINPQSQRNSDPPILISEKIFKNRKMIEYNNNKEESTPSFLNEKNNKENDKINCKANNQFKSRKINLPKNAINLDNIKLNNHILQNIINKKKNNLVNKEQKLRNEYKKKEGNEFDSSRLKVMDIGLH